MELNASTPRIKQYGLLLVVLALVVCLHLFQHLMQSLIQIFKLCCVCVLAVLAFHLAATTNWIFDRGFGLASSFSSRRCSQWRAELKLVLFRALLAVLASVTSQDYVQHVTADATKRGWPGPGADGST